MRKCRRTRGRGGWVNAHRLLLLWSRRESVICGNLSMHIAVPVDEECPLLVLSSMVEG